jgi:hypothetical protein
MPILFSNLDPFAFKPGNKLFKKALRAHINRQCFAVFYFDILLSAFQLDNDTVNAVMSRSWRPAFRILGFGTAKIADYLPSMPHRDIDPCQLVAPRS